MEYQKISILTPTFNRSKFLLLYLHNIKSQSYPHNYLDVIIDDDGDEPFISNLDEVRNFLFPIKLTYLRYNQKRSIGVKRNNLVKNSKNKIFMFFDDDDIYAGECVHYCYKELMNNKYGLVGSSQMLFYHLKLDKFTAIQCNSKTLIHEATMMMTRKYFNSMGGFKFNGVGEGKKMIQSDNDKRVGDLEILKIMVCLDHGENTVAKDRFKHNQPCEIKLSQHIKDIINNIFK